MQKWQRSFRVSATVLLADKLDVEFKKAGLKFRPAFLFLDFWLATNKAVIGNVNIADNRHQECQMNANAIS